MLTGTFRRVYVGGRYYKLDCLKHVSYRSLARSNGLGCAARGEGEGQGVLRGWREGAKLVRREKTNVEGKCW